MKYRKNNQKKKILIFRIRKIQFLAKRHSLSIMYKNDDQIRFKTNQTYPLKAPYLVV